LLGPLADRVGRRSVIIGSTLAFGIITVLTGAFADSLASLIVWRFLTGIGLGGAMPNSIALTAEYAPRRYQSTLVMVMFCGFPLGASFAGFVAGEMIGLYGWRSVLYVGGILPIALVLLLLARLPESIRHLVLEGKQARRIRAILVRINPTATYAEDTRFIVSEQHGSGVPVKYLFMDGRALATVLLWITFFMSLLNIFLINFWLPKLAQDAGIPDKLSHFATGLFQAGGVAGILVLGLLVDRFGSYRVLAPTYFLAALFIGLIGFVAAEPYGLLLAATLAGVFVIGGQTGANALASTFYPTFIRSTGIGWALGIGRIGSIAGPFIGGTMIDFKAPVVSIFILGGVAGLCAALAVFGMGRTQVAAPLGRGSEFE
jgi:MFS transporter, AAHS family, 4-hydroxybenzoate transporter